MNIVSFGGGTNSTAMIIGMYLHKIPIDLILFADTGASSTQPPLMKRTRSTRNTIRSTFGAGPAPAEGRDTHQVIASMPESGLPGGGVLEI